MIGFFASIGGRQMQISEKFLRQTLYFTFAYNVMGFFMFLLPAKFGGIAGLPVPAPFVYSGFVAFNILLFGFVGLWQARRPLLDAPVLTTFGATKVIFCLIMLTSWLIGEIKLMGFLMSLVDLTMGVIFLLGAQSAQMWNAEKSRKT